MTRDAGTREGSRHNARRRKRRLALWSAVPALAALAVAAKLLSVGVLGGSASEAFAARQEESLGRASGWLLYANVLEPHKAYVASGDAHALAGDFAAARKDFASALSANPGFDECKVRVNLALSIEKLGDAAVEAQTPDAGTLFAEALSVVQESPSACRHEGPANADGEGDALDAAEARLVHKKAGGGASEAAASPPPGQSPAHPQQEQLRKLQESAEQAQRERQEGQDRDRYLNGPDNPGMDRPW
ncbi:hypothetical protein IG195_16425 [Arthrobacter sp. TES]|uniref:hypothetical protein n=1 Tax=Paenarthrobacter ureafaciens TaxID=37931 RepID=UPI000397E7B7|nr:hypothetical protein [Paenarthrobacter ureafaciens]QOI63061.1 hypothetical protein IG195_16425 [Arthrobacter sp. TES]GLU59936.1 hypothetical protein Pure01_24490 [Paenarthrobacter ureafaciens]GLU64267.1 hypothetical protein Pure02_25170 [Paenarthrobacter ureafaciens]GLU68544.1 hypothetical protein Pure03_25200 [Paenarthrobacter ureafaciens]GLU72802.1 hypothetical protein Pure04_25170 [Paenarthrobacter ureafaciens]